MTSTKHLQNAYKKPTKSLKRAYKTQNAKTQVALMNRIVRSICRNDAVRIAKEAA